MSRREEAERRRAHIVDAAIGLMGEKGFRGFTLQQLAGRSGLTNGGVLYHFASKEEVLGAVLEDVERRLSAGIVRSVGEHAGREDGQPLSRDAVLRVLRALLAESASSREVSRLLAMLQIEALDPEHPAHDHMARHSRSVFERFARMFGNLSDRPDRHARQAMAMMNGLCLLWLEDPRFDLLAEWDAAIAAILPASPMGAA
jgi:AcrR family transcriptional regulator